MRSWPILLLAAVGCAAAPPREVDVKVLTSAAATASGQPIRLPGGDAKIVLSSYLIPAGARLPAHKHLHTRLALVQEGTITVTNEATGQTAVYGPGDMVVEAVDQWHFGVNSGGGPVRLLVLDALPADATTNTVLKPR